MEIEISYQEKTDESIFRNITREQVRKSKALPGVPFVVLTCPDRAKAMPPLFSAVAIEQMAKLGKESADTHQKIAKIMDGRRKN